MNLNPSVAFAHDGNGTSYDDLTDQTTSAAPCDLRADHDVFLIGTGAEL